MASGSAQPLVNYQGRLVPIEVPRADSPPVRVPGSPEVIDLTDDSDEAPTSSSGSGRTSGAEVEVIDLAGEEEEQAEEEERRGILTFHAEVERARRDPAPEYDGPPRYDE